MTAVFDVLLSARVTSASSITAYNPESVWLASVKGIIVAKKVGFVGGGQMAMALAAGAVAAKFLKSNLLVFAEPDATQAAVLQDRFEGCVVVSDAQELLPDCEQVVLAVKPHILKSIANQLAKVITQDHLLVSIAAGISLEQLQSTLKTNRVIRVMPNTPCQVGEGSSGMSASNVVADSDIAWVRELMSSVGIVEQVPDDLMHAVTGVAGSSPAYVYLVIEALSDGGVAHGLPRETATKLAAQAVLGAAKMVLETGQHPGALKDQVTSPGGTTIAALRELEAAATRSAFIEAVDACVQRSEELS